MNNNEGRGRIELRFHRLKTHQANQGATDVAGLRGRGGAQQTHVGARETTGNRELLRWKSEIGKSKVVHGAGFCLRPLPNGFNTCSTIYLGHVAMLQRKFDEQ